MTVRPADAVPSTLLQVAGGLLALAGFFAAAVAVQFLMWWTLPPAATGACTLMLVGGLTTLGTAWFVADGRTPAVATGVILAAALTAGSSLWALWALANLSFTLFMFVTPVLAGWSTVLLPFTIPAAQRCTQARATFPQGPFGLAGS